MKRTLITLVGLLAAPLAAIHAAAAPKTQPERLDSAPYVAGKEGYACYRVPALVVSAQGTVLAFCEGRVQNHKDEGDIDTVLKRSADGGKTWRPLQVLANDGLNPCKNACPVVLLSGRILVVYLWNKSIPSESQRTTREVFVTHSDDDGLTWSQPRNITRSVYLPDWEWYGTGPCHAIVKRGEPHKGRIVVPSRHNTKKTHTVAHLIYSDDGGETWQLGGSVPREQSSESSVAELSNGDLMLNCHNQNDKENHRVVAISKDGGATFSEVWLETALIEPRGCQGSLLFHSVNAGTGKGNILFSNPNNGETRSDGTLKLSEDDARRWTKAFRYAKQPAPYFTGYSDIAAMPNGDVAILYERGDISSAASKKERYDEIGFTVVKFNEIKSPLPLPKQAKPETNIATHPEAARLVAAEWPTEIVWQGFEVGNPVITGEALKRTPASNPVRRAFELRLFGKRPSIEGGQPSYDQAAAFYAVRGTNAELWSEERGGRVVIDQTGFSRWVADAASPHVMVTRVCAPDLLARQIEALMVAPPKNATPGKSK